MKNHYAPITNQILLARCLQPIKRLEIQSQQRYQAFTVLIISHHWISRCGKTRCLNLFLNRRVVLMRAGSQITQVSGIPMLSHSLQTFWLLLLPELHQCHNQCHTFITGARSPTRMNNSSSHQQQHFMHTCPPQYGRQPDNKPTDGKQGEALTWKGKAAM